MTAPRTPLTRATIERRVEEIRTLARACSGGAHEREDALHVLVLEAIASGRLAGLDAAEAARLSLATREIDLPRWYE